MSELLTVFDRNQLSHDIGVDDSLQLEPAALLRLHVDDRLLDLVVLWWETLILFDLEFLSRSQGLLTQCILIVHISLHHLEASCLSLVIDLVEDKSITSHRGVILLEMTLRQVATAVLLS